MFCCARQSTSTSSGTQEATAAYSHTSARLNGRPGGRRARRGHKRNPIPQRQSSHILNIQSPSRSRSSFRNQRPYNPLSLQPKCSARPPPTNRTPHRRNLPSPFQNWRHRLLHPHRSFYLQLRHPVCRHRHLTRSRLLDRQERYGTVVGGVEMVA